MSERDHTKLWEQDHPYYCAESNFRVGREPRVNSLTRQQHWENFVPYNHVKFDSWEDFGWKDNDPDMNLLVRWDWKQSDPSCYVDVEVPQDRLILFWLLQRKGDFMITSFPVEKTEEPEIRAWLSERYKAIEELWRPITSGMQSALYDKS